MPGNSYKDVTLSQMMLRIGRMSWKTVHARKQNSNLSNVQYKVCVVIHNTPGLSQDNIARELGMDKSSIAKCIAKLIETGYVVRTLNPDDHREYQLKLSEKGEADVEEFVALVNDWEKRLCDQIGPDTYSTLKNLVSEMAAICEQE